MGYCIHCVINLFIKEEIISTYEANRYDTLKLQLS